MTTPATDRELAIRVLGAAAGVYDVSASDALASRGNRHGHSEARQASALVLWRSRSWSQSRIGRALDRDHSTIGQALKRAQERLRSGDDWFAEAVRRAERVGGFLVPTPPPPTRISRARPWTVPAPLVRGAA